MKKNGISLIVLVITIIVIIVLAGAVILSLANNNPILQANKATFLSDLKNFETELTFYETQQFADKLGMYDATKLQADETSVIYDNVALDGKTMDDIITSLGKNIKYAGQFIVVDGKLVYQGSDTSRQIWVAESGIQVIVAGEPKVNIIAPNETIVMPGTDIVYTIKFTSNTPLTTIDLNNKVEVLDDNNVALTTQPTIIVGTVSGTSSDTTRQVDITIKTDSLIIGSSYKLKIKSGSVTNAENKFNSQDTISLIGFDIADIIPPENPVISANPTTLTNGNVTVTITYSGDSSVKEYSLDAITWIPYTIPVVVTDNNTTVYARGKDSSGNESGVATLTVENIDKILPIVTYGTNGGNNLTTANTIVTVADTGSGVNAATLQYKWDTQNTIVPTTGLTVFTNGTTLTKTGVAGTYYLWIIASDNVGNKVNSVSNEYIFVDDVAPTIAFSPNGGTNVVVAKSTVTVTDTGSGVDAATLQYKWDTQNTTEPTTGWAVFTNGTQLSYSDSTGNRYLWIKASDNAGNQKVSKTSVFSIITAGTQVYVDSANGNDTNDGGSNGKVKTFDRAYTLAANNGVIHLVAGTYTVTNPIAKPITISGAGSTTILTNGTSDLITNANTTFDSVKFQSTCIAINTSSINVTFSACTMAQTGRTLDGSLSGIVSNSGISGSNMYFNSCSFTTTASKIFASYASGTTNAYIRTTCSPYALSNFSNWTFSGRVAVTISN